MRLKVLTLTLFLLSCDNYTESSLGVCTNSLDCAGICGGQSVVDSCGVCGGDNSPDTDTCDCNGNPNGNAVVDCAGVCGGSASACITHLGLSLNDEGALNVTYSSNEDIYGFQFYIDGVTVISVFGGVAETNGFSTSTGNNTVLGFSLSGSFILAGSGVLTMLNYYGSGIVCISDPILSAASGVSLDVEITDCISIR